MLYMFFNVKLFNPNVTPTFLANLTHMIIWAIKMHIHLSIDFRQ